MSMLVIILMWTLFGAASAYYAQIKGRDPILWFVLGALLGILSLIILFFLPAVETKEAPPSEEEEAIVEEPSSYKSMRFKEWFYMDQNHHQKGPVSFTVLQRLYFDKALSLSTLVWTEGMEGWSKIEDLSELKDALG